jgi:predicted alpha/beta-fold hydrolase
VLRRLRANETTALFVVAISLSANTFLKWCGETGESAGHLVDAAAAVCAPVDMVAAGQNLSRGFGAIYGRYFLRTLLPKALAKQSRFPGHLDRLTLASIRTLYDFDEHVTAPLHGFHGAMDYWQQTSSNKLLFRVRVPTLLLHSRNDPLIPYASVPPARSLSSSIVPETPQHGGHVGFASGGRQAADDRATWPDWLPQRILAHFDLLRAPV